MGRLQPENNPVSGGRAARTAIPTDRMTYRTNDKKGDRVSLLGYGCMRWPTLPSPDGRGNVIDQDAVNELVDYAIAHGVNYFDTSPVYVQGWSEKSTGIALKRHPREKFLIATKLSNFANHTRENSIAMYRKSFEDLQVDYIDYYLLHSIGNGGIDTFRARYIDNGMLDFLLGEREAGRIRNLGFSFHGTVDVFDEVLAMDERAHWDFVQIQLNYVDWKHASGNNVDAEYLYGELAKRGIQAIIMEPLLGGRLSNVPDHIAAHLKQRRPEASVASWAFRFARLAGKGTDCAERHDLSGASAGQPAHLFAARTAYRRRQGVSRADRATAAALPDRSLQRLPILHAVSLRIGHSGHSAAL